MEVEIVAFVVEVLEFDFVKNGAIHKFFGAEAIINHCAAFLRFFMRVLHGAALISRGCDDRH